MHEPWQGCCFDLREQPELLDVLLLWLHAEWLKQRADSSQNPAEAYGLRRIQLQEHLNASAIPLTIVAKEIKEREKPPLGCVSLTRLVASSPIVAPELKGALWLSNLFVTPTARGRGVGDALVFAAEQRAKALGLNEVYLYTSSSKAYYLTKGWQECIMRRQASSDAGVMKISVLKKSLR